MNVRPRYNIKGRQASIASAEAAAAGVHNKRKRAYDLNEDEDEDDNAEILDEEARKKRREEVSLHFLGASGRALEERRGRKGPGVRSMQLLCLGRGKISRGGVARFQSEEEL